MIFNKILKGTDLTFDISLEKTDYRPGEIVRGKLILKIEKSCKARKLILFAEGIESTVISTSENTGHGSSSRDRTTRTYKESSTFFSEDLSHLLEKSASSNILQDGTLEILAQNNEIAFDFHLPDNNSLFSSYKGKHASVTYTVKATADIAKKLDVNEEEHFHVINPNNNKVVSSNSNTSFNTDSNSDTINSTPTIENESNISSLPTIEAKEEVGKGIYSERFKQIFGKEVDRTSSQSRPRYFTSNGTSINFDLGTIFAKGRDHFLKENSEAKINLSEHEDNNTTYSPGNTIKGEVILLLLPANQEEAKKRRNIRGMKITLSGIEHAFAQGLQRVNTVEGYEKNIELNGNENGEKNHDTIPFEFQIPEGINQSYIGKYSEYFWGLEAKVNIAWSSDITARTIIEIV
jgi:Arrestin (or S-antigen), N-terminal domain